MATFFLVHKKLRGAGCSGMFNMNLSQLYSQQRATPEEPMKIDLLFFLLELHLQSPCFPQQTGTKRSVLLSHLQFMCCGQESTSLFNITADYRYQALHKHSVITFFGSA